MLNIRTATALAISLAVTGVLGAAALPASAHPGPSRPGAPTCRGEGVDPAAKIRYSTDVVIDASIETIWKLQTDVERWPAWQSPVLSAERLDPGRLREGSAFRWTTPAPATPSTPETTLEITSTVQELKRHKCLRWTGPAVGEGLRIDEGVHVWTFTKVKGGVRVRTEETWTGEQVEADVPLATEILGMGLEGWLDDLKAAAEARG
ncbi:SRPBCC family protein [Streptomyces cinnabarinus]|uniref:SRPBCC family protein n=1 Tax=Streptomyces cinnabarinus TaxID=67287 RepID=A0ABY7K493_9ACTN|nr:SRPBCC family protein [Streptomyces cinnabarinus]WAZ19164.1 SRPBCC family protein [Streptomyces cinnabarinus]